MRINYDPTVPDSFVPLVSERLDGVAELFPVWCDRLVIAYDAANKEDVATAHPLPSYRMMTLELHPLFFESPDWEQDLIHEAAHGIVKPYVQIVDKIVETYVPEAIRQYILDQLSDAEEGLAEDLAIFARKCKESD
jgi:hypothetical protein